MSMTRYVNPLPRPKTLSNDDPVPGLNIEGEGFFFWTKREFKQRRLCGRVLWRFLFFLVLVFDSSSFS